jgi:hypothetical protein
LAYKKPELTTAAGTSLNNNTQKLQLQGSFAGTRIKLWFKNLRIDNRGEFKCLFFCFGTKAKDHQFLEISVIGCTYKSAHVS